jgi:hypothetical protein
VHAGGQRRRIHQTAPTAACRCSRSDRKTGCRLTHSPESPKRHGAWDAWIRTGWCRLSDSNRRPIAYKASALPTELKRRERKFYLTRLSCGRPVPPREGPRRGWLGKSPLGAGWVFGRHRPQARRDRQPHRALRPRKLCRLCLRLLQHLTGARTVARWVARKRHALAVLARINRHHMGHRHHDLARHAAKARLELDEIVAQTQARWWRPSSR